VTPTSHGATERLFLRGMFKSASSAMMADRLPLPALSNDAGAPVRGVRGVLEAPGRDSRGFARVPAAPSPLTHPLYERPPLSLAAQQAAEASALRHNNGRMSAPIAGVYPKAAAQPPTPPPPTAQTLGLGATGSTASQPLSAQADASVVADMMRSNWEVTPLNRALFSDANTQIVQNALRRRVYEATEGRYLIGPQDADELRQVLRAQYLQYGRNLPTGVAHQIAELNERAVEWMAPRVVSAIQQDEMYQRDLTRLPVPLQLPVLMTQTGTRSRPLPAWP
jgi:hypothetical protein